MRRLRGAEISMIFQEPLSAPNPLMCVGSQVTEVMTVHRRVPSRAAARARTLELLAAVKIPDPAEAARAYPHQLSGGQRQRAMIAMALANDPALLLADEPTTALDVTVQSQVLELISAQVRARGTGLLFITHDLAVVANMCTRALVLNQGRIVELGPIDEVFTAPAHPHTRALLAASDMIATDARGRLFTLETSTSDVLPVVREARPAAPEAQLPAADPVADAAPGAEGALITVSGLGRTYQRARTKAFGPRPITPGTGWGSWGSPARENPRCCASWPGSMPRAAAAWWLPAPRSPGPRKRICAWCTRNCRSSSKTRWVR
ncbi:oligopeptide ABC transporter ATP-binding protein [Paeniglutamicibacter gangotriensis Lz1y]|uniref:Oligopeptide ABC transporter ATP-binding protein n=1 Tax=Paeniglutamicibacter gangotriensis Lz1y TaxID=1276920 RepID=M7MNM9_9MICC|nr:oligopeptide ABC transporter ATP-binding protein [Paeniglutamicibacter gangotriensis Lz1y]